MKSDAQGAVSDLERLVSEVVSETGSKHMTISEFLNAFL